MRMIPLRTFVIAMVGFTVVFALGVAAVVLIDQRDEREDDQQELDNNYLSCLRGNEFRELIRDGIVEPAFAGQALDLTLVPGFENLSAEEQTFFENLAEISASRPSPKGEIVAGINTQIRDCENEWAGHTSGIHLPHERAIGAAR